MAKENEKELTVVADEEVAGQVPAPGDSDEAASVPQSNRDRFLARLRERYPDDEWDDDEAIFGRANEDYDEYENELTGLRENEAKFTSLFNADRRAAQFMTDWANTGTPVVGLVRRYGREMVEQLNDPDPANVEAIAAAEADHLKRESERVQFEEEYERNTDASLGTIEQKRQELGIDNETVQEVLTFLKDIQVKLEQGIVTGEMIDMALKAINHDADVETAAQAAEVRGRNANIEERLRKPQTDGVPSLGGSTAGVDRGRKSNIFDIAAGAQ